MTNEVSLKNSLQHEFTKLEVGNKDKNKSFLQNKYCFQKDSFSQCFLCKTSTNVQNLGEGRLKDLIHVWISS